MWDIDLTSIEKYLTIPEKCPKYREQRHHRHFITNISKYLHSTQFTPTYFENCIIKYLSQFFKVHTITLNDLNDIINFDTYKLNSTLLNPQHISIGSNFNR